MTIRPLSTLTGIRCRSAADHALSHLFAEVVSAREADQVARGAPRREIALGSDSGRLAASLTAYARALEGYQLPVPPGIRDELRLRRGLPS